MQAIELETEIDENHEIHLKLPDNVRAHRAKVVVMYEDAEPGDTTSTPGADNAGKTTRLFGQYRGAVRMGDDFDAPLPEAFWTGGNP